MLYCQADRKWLRVVKKLISGERVTVDGDNFKLDGYRLKPASKLDMLENCGHFISIKRPAETALAIADFLLVAE